MKTGGGLLRVRFWHEIYPEGVQDKEGDWKVLERTPGLLRAHINDRPVRLAHIRDLSWKWLGDRFRIYRNPGKPTYRRGWGSGRGAG